METPCVEKAAQAQPATGAGKAGGLVHAAALRLVDRWKPGPIGGCARRTARPSRNLLRRKAFIEPRSVHTIRIPSIAARLSAVTMLRRNRKCVRNKLCF